MDMRRIEFLAIVASVAIAAAACPPPATAEEGVSTGLGDDIAVAKLAWQRFVEVNHGAVSGGEPAPWETWASADDIFEGGTEPAWTDAVAEVELETEPRQQALFRALMAALSAAEMRPGSELPQVASRPSLVTQVQLDRKAFDWVKLAKLWCLDGQRDHFERARAGRSVDVEFPAGSTLVKAVWKPISEQDKPRYYWRLIGGEPHGLIAFHLTAKLLPTWFWATWEHLDNPGRAVVTHPDPWGIDVGEPSRALLELLERAGLEPERWSHYRLNGTQIAYTDAEGRPTVLANSIIEAGFTTRSSCMTCHARATIGESDRLSFDTEVGNPDPAWFVVPSEPPTRAYLPLDFLWSLQRARPCPTE
jgi:hypothetical protein